MHPTTEKKTAITAVVNSVLVDPQLLVERSAKGVLSILLHTESPEIAHKAVKALHDAGFQVNKYPACSVLSEGGYRLFVYDQQKWYRMVEIMWETNP